MTKSKAHRAEVSISAPTLTILHITIALVLGRLLPLPFPAPMFVQKLGLGFAALGFIVGLLALIEFRRVGHASDPKGPAGRLVTSGVYRYTRNPIYLGFALMLIGIPLNTGSYWGVILLWPLITLTNNLIIKYEEAHLTEEFDTAYMEYSSRVRRWL